LLGSARLLTSGQQLFTEGVDTPDLMKAKVQLDEFVACESRR
jgi:hypothetical protein